MRIHENFKNKVCANTQPVTMNIYNVKCGVNIYSHVTREDGRR